MLSSAICLYSISLTDDSGSSSHSEESGQEEETTEAEQKEEVKEKKCGSPISLSDVTLFAPKLTLDSQRLKQSMGGLPKFRSLTGYYK